MNGEIVVVKETGKYVRKITQVDGIARGDVVTFRRTGLTVMIHEIGLLPNGHPKFIFLTPKDFKNQMEKAGQSYGTYYHAHRCEIETVPPRPMAS